MFKNSKNATTRGRGDATLDRAIAELRGAVLASQPSLEASRRAAIVEMAFAGQARIAEAPSLFVTTRRWVMGGLVPSAALVATLAIFPVLWHDSSSSAIRLTASKHGGEVVFKVANGATPHAVYKSTSPETFNPAAAIPVTNGSFKDTVNDGSEIIFYRID